MSSPPSRARTGRRAMVNAAVAMYGAGTLDGVLQGFLPGDPRFSPVPVIAVAAILVALLAFGVRLPRRALALLGPLGVVLTAYAVATSPGAGDGAILYAMPVLWTTLFFGRAGALAIVTCVGVGQAVALLILPAAVSNPARWLDVMVAVGAISLVMLALERGNEVLVRRLADEARTDVLTGLLNRRGFDERVVVEVAHARRQSANLAALALDIDHFKQTNDELGHETGDAVLARVGQLLAAVSRDIDVPARIGGDEFVILMPGADRPAATALWKRLTAALESGDDHLPRIRLSGGIAVSRTPDIAVLLGDADAALYEAKRRGGNRAVPHDGAERHPAAPRRSGSLRSIPTPSGSA